MTLVLEAPVNIFILCFILSDCSKTLCTNMHGLGIAVHVATNLSDVWIPDMIGTSMWMGYIISEMNALITNITLCHCYTSSANIEPINAHNIDILTDCFYKCKKKIT